MILICHYNNETFHTFYIRYKIFLKYYRSLNVFDGLLPFTSILAFIKEKIYVVFSNFYLTVSVLFSIKSHHFYTFLFSRSLILSMYT